MINNENIIFSSHDPDLSKKEWLITNGIGGYASSTLCCMHTRKYHGLLIASLEPPVDRFVLLSSLDEEIYVGEQCFELATHDYSNIIHPHGYKYIKKFSLKPFPKWEYEINDIKVTKTFFMEYRKNNVFIKYNIFIPEKIENCSIQIHALVNMRNFHHVRYKNENIYQHYTENSTLIHTKEEPNLHLNLVSNIKYIQDEKWYFNFKYEIEKERGYDSIEDCFHPGYFEINLAAGNNEFFIMGGVEQKNCSMEYTNEVYNNELIRLKKLSATNTNSHNVVFSHLLFAADHFLVKRKSTGKYSIIAGYPWFADWGRDTMISIPGLTLVTGRYSIAASILTTFAINCRKGLIPNRFPDKSAVDHYDYNTVDASLWFINAVWKYLQYSNDITTVKNLWPIIYEIIHNYSQGTDFGIKMDEDYMIKHDGQLTWMDAKVKDIEITPRKGKACEINALWYNALMISSIIADELGINNEIFKEKAHHVLQNYANVFWNENKDSLYDYIGCDEYNREYKDDAIRPNQIIAISLPFPVIQGEKAIKIIKTVETKLLTPRGLRTLERENECYVSTYHGDVISRDKAYHNGTVWPWLIGPYISAYCKIQNHSFDSKVYAQELIDNFMLHLSEAGIGNISEIFDAEEPYKPRGCIAQAWSVAEILRAYAEDIVQQN